MCTVSIARVSGLTRVMCNRDERHERPVALAPVVARAGRHLAIHPVDPQGGGTWIAATGAGLVLALLNEDGPAVPNAPSRGRIVLELLACPSIEDAGATAQALAVHDWSPFRLIATDGVTLFDMRARAGRYVVCERAVADTEMFTSSSLGEAVVAPHRTALFESLLASTVDAFDAQDAFHQHRWPDRPHLSVHMRRSDAATQSITTVDLRQGTVAMRYASTIDIVGAPASLSIERRPAAAAALVVAEAARAMAAPSFAVAS